MTARLLESWRGAVITGWLALRAIARELGAHWRLAMLSVFSASAIWFVIQDIENPRIEGTVPVDPAAQGVPVEFVNLSPDVIAAEAARVRVHVEAREADLPDLSAADFRAVVDLQGVRAGSTVSRPVKVTSVDDSVIVLGVEPPQVLVQVVELEEREIEVRVNVTGQLPSGFEETQRVIDPAFATIRGRAELVQNVDRVEIDVNLSGQRQGFKTSGELVARNRNGDRQLVTITPATATVSFTVSPSIVSKVLPVLPHVTGQPALGYVVTGVSTNPATVTVRGPAADLAGLTEITIESLDVSGASTTVTQTRRLPALSSVTTDRETVVVEVGIEPIQCGSSSPTETCAAATFYVAPVFLDVPAGLTIEAGRYVVPVQVSGPVAEITTLDPRSIAATISLTTATSGESTHTPAVTVPNPFRVESVGRLPVRLVPVSSP